MNLLISFRSEILKTKRTPSFYLTIITAAIIPLMFLLDVCFDGVSEPNRKDSLNAFFRQGFMMTGVLIFPMFVILVCTLLPQIEYKNNTWKQLFASPQTMPTLFFAKFLNVHLLILTYLVTYNIFMAIAIVAVHFIDPALHLLNQPLDGTALLTKNVNSYLAVLAVSAIQFWIGFHFKNFIVPIAIGIALWFAGSMMLLEFRSASAAYFPYSYLGFTTFPQYKSKIAEIELRSATYAVVFLIIAFVDFRRRRLKA
jgi:hypothetical protein